MTVKNWFWNWFGLTANQSTNEPLSNAFPVGDNTQQPILHRAIPPKEETVGTGGAQLTTAIRIKELLEKDVVEKVQEKEETTPPIFETETVPTNIAVEKVEPVAKSVKKKSVKTKKAAEPEFSDNFDRISAQLDELKEYAKTKAIRLTFPNHKDNLWLRFHPKKHMWMAVNPNNYRRRWVNVLDSTIANATGVRK